MHFTTRPRSRSVTHTSHQSPLLLLLLLLLHALLPNSQAETVLATTSDLDGLELFGPRPITSWRWSPQQKADASRFSEMSISSDGSSSPIWKIRVDPEIPFVLPYLEVLSLGANYLPPEADAIRMKVRAISGTIHLTFGGPTAYFGNSDVFLRPVEITAHQKPSDWATIELSLHEGLIRNFRRPSFSRTSPTIHYTRWTQEPTYAYLLRGSAGEAHITDIEIISHGCSQPFPDIALSQTTNPHPIADLSSKHHTSKLFTALIGDTETEFVSNPDQHPPATIMHFTDPTEGPVAQVKGRFLEEVSAIGVEIPPDTRGDTLHLRARIDSPIPSRIAPNVPAQPLDILLYESPDPSRFNGSPFVRPTGSAAHDATRFDRNLSHANLLKHQDLPLAIYQARRFTPPATWTDTLIPLEDFVCIHAQGSLTERFQRQLPPQPTHLISVALVPPWPRKGRPETTITLHHIQLVTRINPGTRRSYFQSPITTLLRGAKDRYAFQLLSGEQETPSYLLRIFAP